MTAQWAVRAALTDERRARRKNPTAPAMRTSFERDWFFFYAINFTPEMFCGIISKNIYTFSISPMYL